MRKAFSLTEVLIGIVLVGLVMLAVSSVDITAHQFFAAAHRQSKAQDELKIVMEHIVKNTQLGIGDADHPGTAISPGGTRIQVNRDGGLNGPGDGRFNPASDPNDVVIEYEYIADAAHPENNRMLFYPNAADRNNVEELARGIIAPADTDIFAYGAVPNEIIVTIATRPDLSRPEDLGNSNITLTSSVVLRAMSTH